MNLRLVVANSRYTFQLDSITYTFLTLYTSFIQMTNSVNYASLQFNPFSPTLFLMVAKWVYPSVQRHTGLT